MKKLRLIALVLMLAMVLCIPAAAAVGDVKTGEVADLKLVNGDTTAEFTPNGEMVTVTVTSSSLKAGTQYVILMLKHTVEDDFTYTGEPTPTEDSIVYINQDAAKASGSKGTITFDVYPSAMTDGIIMITGADSGKLVLAIINGKWILGDLDGDGEPTAIDALMILRFSGGRISLTDQQMNAGDIDGDGEPTAIDALRVLRFSAGRIDSLK